MERLTSKYPSGLIAVPQGMMPEALDRLAAYEDTGLEPEDIEQMKARMPLHNWAGESPDKMSIFGCTVSHLRSLVEAEKDGRLVVLPCKVGDTVYIPTIEKQNVDRARVQGISISVSGRTILRFGGYPIGSAWGDGCGKDWFLTREEAEAALEGGKDA